MKFFKKKGGNDPAQNSGNSKGKAEKKNSNSKDKKDKADNKAKPADVSNGQSVNANASQPPANGPQLELAQQPNSAPRQDPQDASRQGNRPKVPPLDLKSQKSSEQRNKVIEQSRAAPQNGEGAGQNPAAAQSVPPSETYLSENMKQMQMLLNQSRPQSDNHNALIRQFSKLCNGLRDRSEVLMALYLAVSVFAEENAFSIMLQRNNSFKDYRPEWHDLFSQVNIYQTLLWRTSAQRQQLNLLTLKVAVYHDYIFMIEEVLGRRAYVTAQTIEYLLREEQYSRLISMISIPRQLADWCSRPRFLDSKDKQYRQALRKIFASSRRNPTHDAEAERELHFNDIIGVAFSIQSKTDTIIKLITLMRKEVQQKTMPNIENQLDYKELYRLFVRLRKIKLLRYIFNLKSEFQFEIGLFITALEEDAYDVAMLLHREFKYVMRNNSADDDRTINSLIIQSIIKVNEGAGMINEKSYLIRECMEKFHLRNARVLLDNIDRLSGFTNKQNILVTNFNVVKTACLLIEILELIGVQFEQLGIRCQSIRQRIEDKVEKYLKEVKNESEMRYLLLEKDFDDRDALELITVYEIVSFLRTQYAENVVKEIWRSPYATNDMIFQASTNYFLLFQYYNCIQDDEKNYRLLRGKNVKNIENHSMQFMVWRYSAKSRIIIEFIASLMITIPAHVLLQYAQRKEGTVRANVTEILQLEKDLVAMDQQTDPAQYQLKWAALQQRVTDSQPVFEEFLGLMVDLAGVSILCLFFGFQYLADVTYCAVTKKNYNPYSFKNVLDVLIFFVFLINIFVTFRQNLNNAIREGPSVVDWQKKAEVYCKNYTDNDTNEMAILIIGVVLLWFRIVNFFRFNEYLGKFIGIVRNLIKEIALFFGLYLCNLTAFSLIAEASFHDVDGYETAAEAFRTLFFASFGSFDFDKVEAGYLGRYFGVTYLIVFIVINIGIFMSLFIAIITALFQDYEENESVYQMIETLKIRSVTQAEKSYSCLVSFPPPFNFLLFFTAPFLITSPTPEKVNEKLLFLAYLPILCFSVMTFVFGEMLMWPFVYTKMVFHKLTMVWVYSKSWRLSRADKFANFVGYCFFGPFTTVANTFVDTHFFVRHMVRLDLQKFKHKIDQPEIDKDNMKLLEALFYKKQEKILNYRYIAERLRSLMGIMPLIRQSLFPYSFKDLVQGPVDFNLARASIDSKHLHGIEGPYQRLQLEDKYKQDHDMLAESRKKMILKIKQFGIVKEILDGNSQVIGVSRDTLKQQMDDYDRMNPHFKELMQTKFKCLDCKIINSALQELKRQKMLAKVKEDQYIFLQRFQPLGQRSRTRQIEAQNAPRAGKKAKGGKANVRRFETGENMNIEEEDQIAPGLKGERKMEDLLAHRPGQGAKGARLVEKRERNLFKKLSNYRVTRMLAVLKYYPSQSDERKFLHSNYKKMNAGDDSDNDVSPRSEISVSSPPPNFRRRNINSVAHAYQQSSGMAKGRLMAPPSFTDLSQQNYINQMQNNLFKMNQGSLQTLLGTVADLQREIQQQVNR